MFGRIDRRLLTIVLIVFVQILGAAMVLPILPIYARNEFAISENTVTLIISVFFAAQFLAGPFIGRLSDLYGRLPVLIVSQIGTVIAFAMLGLADTVWVLFAARIFDGITGGNIVVAQAYITDITPPKERSQALGYIFAAFGMGFIFGPALGGVLSAAFGPRIPFFFAAGVALLTTLLTWFMLDETLTPERRAAIVAQNKPKLQLSAILSNVSLMLILFITFGAQFSFSMLQSTFALYGEDVLFPSYNQQDATLRIGLLLSVVGVGQLVTQLFILKRMLARFQEYRSVIIGTVLRGSGMLLLVIAPNPILAAGAMSLFAIGAGVQLPPLQGLASNSVDDSLRGGVLGIYQSTQSLGIIFGSALAGTLFAFNPRLPYTLGGVLLLTMIVPSLFLMRRNAVPHGQLAT